MKIGVEYAECVQHALLLVTQIKYKTYQCHFYVSNNVNIRIIKGI